jgi:Flp pilus assembly protein TadD
LRREAIAQSEAIARSLDSRDLDLVNLAIGRRSLEGASQATEVTEAVSSLVRTVAQLDEVAGSQGVVVPAEVLLETARGLMASDDWVGAARYLDRYIQENPDDWEAQFARGVAHANSRVGQRSNLAALVAYSDAIAFQPDDGDANLVARLHTYRGAMLKRLGRLGEAEADFAVAQRLATDPYEKTDVAYNLACIYAMTNRRDAALDVIRSLLGTAYIDVIRANRSGYFDSLANDAEFESILDQPGALG